MDGADSFVLLQGNIFRSRCQTALPGSPALYRKSGPLENRKRERQVPMNKTVSIPGTDLAIFPIGLGTVDAGVRWDGPQADRIFDTYLDCGGNVIDCAHVYSDWVPGETARAERVLGDWLERSGKRNRITLMTKGGHPSMTGPDTDLHKSRMTRQDMIGDLNGSLKQLRTDHIDLYFYHRDNRQQSVEEEIETMESFVREGKIRYYGCSNWDADRMKEADAYCRRMGYRGFAVDQSLFNLGLKYFRGPADDTLRCTRGEAFQYHVDNRFNLEMPYTGNCGGFFNLYASKGEEAVRNHPYYSPQNIGVAEKALKLCEKYGCSITQVVLGFFYHQPFACVPLYGSASPERIKDACAVFDVPFTDEDYAWLLQ
jgi:aryl-alcohol dehydrogenase-like predicted oxidoreductase